MQPGFFELFFFFSSRRRHTRFDCDWSSDVCSSDLSGHGWLRPHAGIPADVSEVSTENCNDQAGPEEISGRESFSSGSDRKSTRLNSSHSQISYAVFCLKKKKKKKKIKTYRTKKYQ